MIWNTWSCGFPLDNREYSDLIEGGCKYCCCWSGEWRDVGKTGCDNGLIIERYLKWWFDILEIWLRREGRCEQRNWIIDYLIREKKEKWTSDSFTKWRIGPSFQ